MYQMISSDIFAEVPVHVGLALIGALGYVASKYASGLCPHRACPSKVVEDDLKKPTMPANVCLKESETGTRRSKAQNNSTGGVVQGASFAGETEEAVQVAKVTEVNANPEVPQTLSSADQSDTLTQPVDERIARLMAKKAERKARKQERMQMQEEGQVDSRDAPHDEEHREDHMLVSQPGDIEVKKQGDIDSIFEEDHIVKTEVAASKVLDPVCDDCVAPQCSVDVDVVMAELSTSDEALSPIYEEQDSSCDDMAVECIQEADASEEEFDNSHVSAPCGSESCHGASEFVASLQNVVYSPVNYTPVNDGWMAPFDELVRSREEAERDYYGVDTPQYMPVVCVNNQQQFYTDGDQLFMLACIDAPKESDGDAPRLLQPVVDVNDPLHLQFAQDLHAGIIQLPHDQSKVQVLPAAGNTTFHPAWSAQQELWDVCWDVAL